LFGLGSIGRNLSGNVQKAEGETDESGEQAIMEARIGEALAGTEHLTVIGRRLRPGETAPDFCLHYLDLVDLAVHTVRLSDLTGIVRLFSMVNSVERPVCQVVTRRWETFREALPPEAYIYTISMDTPQVQADFQDRTGVLHQALSAQHSAQFGQDYGVWIKEWRLLQRSVLVIDSSDRVVYVEYVTDQMSEPNYAAAIQVVQQAAKQ
jgi:thioredoxin-dependent peroxiredoxin